MTTSQLVVTAHADAVGGSAPGARFGAVVAGARLGVSLLLSVCDAPLVASLTLRRLSVPLHPGTHPLMALDPGGAREGTIGVCRQASAHPTGAGA